ncbi:MAG: hypothetical protein IIA65_02985 [Planctomycetes bacterium]|nr:hypothetical protein [Planctomycetota bacterium]
MSMSDSRARLVQATKKLKSDWRKTQETWLDDNSLQFEKRVMDPLEREVNSTVVAMEHMAILLAQAQHECHSREEGTR